MTIKITKIFFLILLSSQLSCDQKDCGFTTTRLIENSTNYDLVIELYNNGLIAETYQISANTLDEREFNCNLTFCTKAQTSCQDPLWSFQRDSAVVIFDNERFIYYCSESTSCTVNSKNILALNVYAENESGYVMIEKNKFQFEITNDDYDAAIPIE